jgi:L-alanine-DL-glutamate epimerase-like enolase superfamily enzyme
MADLTWKIEVQRLDLKYTWAISRNATDYKTNGFVTVSDGTYTGRGEVAPNIRYGETTEGIVSAFDVFLQKMGPISSVESLAHFLKKEGLPNSLRFGIESAYVHYLCGLQNISVARFLGLSEPGQRTTAYTIPIMPTEKLQEYFSNYTPQRFQYVKLKVNAENLVEFVQEVRSLCSNTFIIDANEAYQDPESLLKDLEKLGDKNVAFVEQPFPGHFVEEYRYTKHRSPYPLFADESLTDEADFEVLKRGFHGVNVKLMKSGGYLNGIRLLKEAKAHQMQTMVGCMVESGLGISSGLTISSLADFLDLDSFLILKNDPYPMVAEQNGMLFLSKAFH